jgi:hypothetical protein
MVLHHIGPFLQYIFLMFHMVSPSGAWYFEGPRGEGRALAGYELDDSSYPPLETTEDYDLPDCQDMVRSIPCEFRQGCSTHARTKTSCVMVAT